jgi:hypothetical protein
MATNPPLTDPIASALARLVDDAQTERRDPAHWEIEQRIDQAGLRDGDPGRQSAKPVGKFKRVWGTLSWSLSNNTAGGEKLVASLISTIQGCGGFRPTSSNYCGADAISNLAAAFEVEGWELTNDGILQPRVLDGLTGKALTAALKTYADRARRGALDNPLLTGTAKDLLEATAGHVLEQKFGEKPKVTNFPTLLAQAFMAIELAIPSGPATNGTAEQQRAERAAYELACAINGLRNKQGTGHGHPWLSTVTDAQARFAIESMGNIASLMLSSLP